MTRLTAIRGPILNPRFGGTVDYFADGVLIGDEKGRVVACGNWSDVAPRLNLDAQQARAASGLVLPPLLDAHIHIPQFPIRGKFLDGVVGMPAGGPLLAGLNRNVFPAEGKCENPRRAEEVVQAFRDDTLAHGTVGGAAYMTVHAPATRIALEQLPEPWSVGLVLMQRNCPEYLRTDEVMLDDDVAELSVDFGRRLIVTDRFAVAVDSPLRQRAVRLAERFGLRMQTHLNEQHAEKAFIAELYPRAVSYTGVYQADGLLGRAPILAHCIQMRGDEWDLVAGAEGAAIAHCPVSNTLLGSGVMPLDEVVTRQIPYAICTDVGASPTTSLLAEMVQYLRVYSGRSKFATPSEALFRTTLAPAQILDCQERIGSFDVGKEFSFIEAASGGSPADWPDANAAILRGLLELEAAELREYEPGRSLGSIVDRLAATGLEVGDDRARLASDFEHTAKRLDEKVLRVTLAGQVVWSRTS